MSTAAAALAKFNVIANLYDTSPKVLLMTAGQRSALREALLNVGKKLGSKWNPVEINLNENEEAALEILRGVYKSLKDS